MGIVTLPVKSPSLKVHPIFRDRLMLMVSPSNPLAASKNVRTSDIAEQPLIFPKTGFTRQVLDKQFRPFRSRLRVTMELASVGMIKRFVAAGLGVSLISEEFAQDEVRAGQVKLIPISDMEVWRELGLGLPARPHAAAFGVSIRRTRASRSRRRGERQRRQGCSRSAEAAC